MDIRYISLLTSSLSRLLVPITFLPVLYFACSDEKTLDNIQDITTEDIRTVDTLVDINYDIADIIADRPDLTDTISDIINDADISSDSEEIQDILNDGDNPDNGSADIEDTSDSDISDIIETDTGTADTGHEILQPLINEIMISPSYSDPELGQYIEIYNPNTSSIDIDNYKLRTDKKEFIISGSGCDTVIQPLRYIVVGATRDSTKNSYAKVRCEWQEGFSLKDASYLELVRSDNTPVERITLSNLRIKEGSSLERNKDDFTPSPSLITFLDDTGLYKGDRGSPDKPNYNLKMREELSESIPVEDRIENENEVLRYPINLAEGDIIAFYADVDRINGDLKLFGSLVDSNGDFISPLDYVSDISYDYFIYHIAEYSGRYYFQIQSDFFYPFEPANIEATYFRADGLRTNKNLIEIKIGDNFQIESFAVFSQNRDLKDIRLKNDMPLYESNDPTIAEVSSNGIITGRNISSTTIYVTYLYSDHTSITDNIVVNVYSQPSNDTCQEAINATDGLNVYASTIGAGDDYNPEGCVYSLFSGPDIVYYVDAEANTTYEVTVTPYGSFDPMIYVIDDCNNQKCIYGTVLNGAGETERLTFKNETFSTKRFYIIIDGEGGDEGTFTLSIIKK